MTLSERARQIDIEEAKAESALLLQRALDRADALRAADRAKVGAVAVPTKPIRTPDRFSVTPRYEIDGVSHTLSGWAVKYDISYHTLYQRIASGRSIEAALRMGPPNRHRSKADPGVVSDFAPLEGTGGGRLLQESTEITFSKKAKSS